MYKPKIEVVRAVPNGGGLWASYSLDEFPTCERAYLVRGLPAPGERVRCRGTLRVHRVEVVRSLWVGITTETGAGYHIPDEVTPYDPEAERLRVAAEAITKYRGSSFGAEPIARAVLDALKEVDDG